MVQVALDMGVEGVSRGELTAVASFTSTDPKRSHSKVITAGRKSINVSCSSHYYIY